jgi:hypothetical protein
VLARERVISAELGEDRDHHAPKKIAASGVLLAG